MARRKDVQPDKNEPVVGEIAIEPVEAPPVVPVAATVEPPASATLAAPAAELAGPAVPKVEAPRSNAATVDAKLPPVAQLGEGAPRAAPPPFLRDHTNRPIPGRPAARPPAPPPTASAKPAAKDKPRSGRFALLAASVGLAACLGAAVGTAGIAGLARILPTSAAAAPPPSSLIAEVHALKNRIGQLNSELAALKASVDSSGRLANAQFGKLVERLDRAERAQADPAAKIAKIAEILDRLDRRPVAAAPPPAGDITGTVTPRPAPDAAAPPKPVIDGWVVRRVYDGVALIEGRMGVIEVEPGTMVPGVGRVEEIKRQDGRWVVVTTKGIIVSAR